MSLFRKPKKQVVQKRVFTQNDDDDDEETMEVQEINPSADKEKKPKKLDKFVKTKQTLLSFDDEEEGGEVFQVKKSSHNKKVMKMFEKEKKKKEPKEEKKEKLKDKDKKEVITDDIVLVVNQSHKKPPTPPPPILSGRDALCAGRDDMDSSEEEEDKDSDGPAHRFAKPENFKKVLESGAIPDAAMIHAARKKRQRAREMGDFMPLEGEEDEESSKNTNKGRLVRDHDNEGSDEERIDMDINMARKDQERRREQFMSAAQSSDQELDEWEDQQIRKGVTGAAMTTAQELMLEYEMAHQQNNQPVIAAQSQLMIDPGVPRTPQMIAEKLKEQYLNVCAARDQNLQKLVRIQEDIEQATQELEEMRIKAPEAAEKFKFYQELRGYITDLVECFDEKISPIANLESRAMDLMASKSQWLIERRRQDVRDQADEVTKTNQIRKGPEHEEKVRRVAEREGRRTRRRKARETPNQSGTKHVEGMSSDDEISQQDILSFDKARALIEQELQEIFEDVVEDYSSAASILIRFEQWRSKDSTAYTEAYATLCLPKVMSPLVRLNLIFWDPLHETVELEKMEWYRTLALYGLHDNETESTLAKDPDINMLPTIIDKVIIPKLTQHVDRCWDPLSSSQTLRLVGTLGRFIRKYPSLGPASKSLLNLFNAVTHKMKSALEHDVFIPITPKLSDSKNQFFQRQFSSGLKLLKNITSWQGIINDNKLKELALTALLNRYLLSSLKFCQLTDAVQKIRLICQILPRIWFQENTPEFKLFTAAINNLYQQLDKDNPLHLESIDILHGIMKTLRSANM